MQDPYGRTPLHVAATVGSLRTVDSIVSHEPNSANVIDIFGCTPLDNAIQKGNQAVVAVLESAGALCGDNAAMRQAHRKIIRWAASVRQCADANQVSIALSRMPEKELEQRAADVAVALRKFVQLNFASMNILVTAVLALTRSEGVASEENQLKLSSHGLAASFQELHEVLKAPSQEYSILDHFFVRTLAPNLVDALRATNRIVAEVRLPTLLLGGGQQMQPDRPLAVPCATREA